MKKQLMLILVGLVLAVGLGLWSRGIQHQQHAAQKPAVEGDVQQTVLPTPAAETRHVAPSQTAQTGRAGGSDSLVATNPPDPIKVILADKTVYPPFNALSALRTNDEAALVSLYSCETALTNKRALTWALVAIGRDASAQALLHTVSMDRQQQQLTLSEWEVMRDTMAALGFIAAYSQQAYDFLIQASSEEYWQRNRTWRAPNASEEAYSNTRYAGLAIQALGRSLRPEASALLEGLKARDDEMVDRLVSPVVSAAFYVDFGNERGRDALLQGYFRGRLFREYDRWRRTEEGETWENWAKTREKHAH